MPAFLEAKLKKQYGAKSSVPYAVMNKLGFMHGSKGTAKGRRATLKHNKRTTVGEMMGAKVKDSDEDGE